MSAESAGGVALVKWLWAVVFSPFIWWLFKRQERLEDKVQQRFTKEETVDQIDLRVKPLKESLDNNTQAIKECSAVISDLRVTLAKQNKESK